MVNAITREWPCSVIHTRDRNDLSVTQLLRKCRRPDGVCCSRALSGAEKPIARIAMARRRFHSAESQPVDEAVAATQPGRRRG